MFVSVIIPYYKSINYIEFTIKSVLQQTYKNFEIIIIYDDNNQKDFKFIQSLKLLDKRIKIINNNKNIGAGLSRNIGIRNSKGDYICFIDSDDLWEKNKLSKQLNFMMRNNYLISHTSYKILDYNKKFISIRIAKNLSYVDLLKSCDVGLSTVIIKKDILNLKRLFPALKTKEDYVLWLRLAKKGYTFYGLNLNLSSWTKRKNSLSSSTIQKILDAIRVYRNYEKMNLFKSIYYTIKLSVYYIRK